MILLDTHIWIWLNLEPDKVSDRTKEAIRSEPDDLIVSAISLWETMLLIQKKRVEIRNSAEVTVRQWKSDPGIRVEPLLPEIAILARTLPINHDNPADRFIGATAHYFNCTLATTDEKLIQLNWLKTIS